MDIFKLYPSNANYSKCILLQVTFCSQNNEKKNTILKSNSFYLINKVTVFNKNIQNYIRIVTVIKLLRWYLAQAKAVKMSISVEFK